MGCHHRPHQLNWGPKVSLWEANIENPMHESSMWAMQIYKFENLRYPYLERLAQQIRHLMCLVEQSSMILALQSVC